MRAGFIDSLQFVYSDTSVPEAPQTRISVDVARGGTAAAQILVDDVRPGEVLKLSVRQKGKAAREAGWHRLIDVPVEKNTGAIGFVEKEGEPRNEFAARRAPFRVYDAMEPVPGRVQATGETAALRLDVPVGRSERPGERRYEVGISGEQGEWAMELVVRVHRVKLPRVGRDSWPYTNWFSYDHIAKRHGLTKWSAAYWRMLRKYAELMAHGRQNTFWVPLREVFEPDPRKPKLNVPRLLRIVDTFTDAGMYWIEGGHWAARTGGEWLSPTFDLNVGRGSEEAPGEWPKSGPLATSLRGMEELASAAGQLMAVIEKEGWQKRWLQHIADEPIGQNATDYRILAGAVRRFMPGIRILDATMDPSLLGAVDVWCPQAQEFQKHRERFEKYRGLGDRVWFYTCCFPGGPWLNRLLDEELLRPTLLGWAAALFRLDGFLHWGFNHYKVDQDPFQQSVVKHGGSNELPGGDTHIVYPGVGRPWSSVRLEAQREGTEDYELLKMLAKRRPAAAGKIIGKVLQGFDQYTKDPAVLRGARRELLAALSK